MVKKAYFDVEWTGPEVDVDQKGNVISKGETKSKHAASIDILLVYNCPSMACGVL
jgi:hypothetical protein